VTGDGVTGDTDFIVERVVRRNFVLVALVFSVVPAVLATLTLLLIALNSINPMQLMFSTSFELRNGSGEHVRAWPLGRHESGQLSHLPLLLAEVPALPALGTGGFAIAPGGSRRVRYDWDDYNFTTIIVRRSNGDLRAIDIPAQSDCCYRHAHDEYVIPPLERLRRATDLERSEARTDYATALKFVAVLLLPCVPAILYRVQRRLR
jgi:hypothetical protein